MARTFLDELWSDWSADWDAAAAQAFDWARKAVALAPVQCPDEQGVVLDVGDRFTGNGRGHCGRRDGGG
jgi:hypothetical protein